MSDYWDAFEKNNPGVLDRVVETTDVLEGYARLFGASVGWVAYPDVGKSRGYRFVVWDGVFLSEGQSFVVDVLKQNFAHPDLCSFLRRTVCAALKGGLPEGKTIRFEPVVESEQPSVAEAP